MSMVMTHLTICKSVGEGLAYVKFPSFLVSAHRRVAPPQSAGREARYGALAVAVFPLQRCLLHAHSPSHYGLGDKIHKQTEAKSRRDSGKIAHANIDIALVL
ncbi:hypothetical protein E2C01_020072 [Portunus trituberculatus]|uniref:Uncharacterized protein n=1 Tax=Portunus trituberculatus TaxID=210409 RepID=A0A5B7DZ12_PORTR|nr:hypothetical protein [Portunus trituberculatus]